MKKRLSIAFVRRGYSSSGGAEAYLKRLVTGVVEAGHQVQLVTTQDWPDAEWPFGPIVRLEGESPVTFANELQRMRSRVHCDVLFSLDRVWTCDVYRAGDGVHRAWLDRRRKFELPLKRFVRNLGSKHQGLLRLEQSLFSDTPVRHVISGSQMVKDEIVKFYGYPAENISVVRNGVPLEQFRFNPEIRTSSREQLNLKPDQTALLFAGSGWERKGLLFAMEAAALLGRRVSKISRCNFRHASRLCRCRHFYSAHDLRPVFQCMPRSAGLRFAGDHHSFQWFQRDYRERCPRIDCSKRGRSRWIAGFDSVLVRSCASRRG